MNALRIGKLVYFIAYMVIFGGLSIKEDYERKCKEETAKEVIDVDFKEVEA